MSQLRTMMVWTGGTLTTGGLLGVIARLVGVHQRVPYLGEMATLPYYGAVVGAGIIGMFMLMTAPAPRRTQNRVRLDERPVQEQMTLRPKDQPIPTTRGFGQTPSTTGTSTGGASYGKAEDTTDPSTGRAQRAPAPGTPAPTPGAPAHTAPRAAANHAQGHAAPAASAQSLEGPEATPAPPMTSGMQEKERPAWGTPHAAHPNDASEDPPARPAPAADPARAAPLPPVDRPDARSRVIARRAELSARLEELESKANQAKVRYGLGKVSAAGYRQYLAEVDRERMMIESELMETDEGH